MILNGAGKSLSCRWGGRYWSRRLVSSLDLNRRPVLTPSVFGWPVAVENLRAPLARFVGIVVFGYRFVLREVIVE